MSDETHVVITRELRDLGTEPRRAAETPDSRDRARARRRRAPRCRRGTRRPPTRSRRARRSAASCRSAARGEREQLARFVDGDRILVLEPRRDEAARLDVEPRVVAGDAHAHGHALAAREVTLAHALPALRERAPGVARQQEFALDFPRHGAQKVVLVFLDERNEKRIAAVGDNENALSRIARRLPVSENVHQPARLDRDHNLLERYVPFTPEPRVLGGAPAERLHRRMLHGCVPFVCTMPPPLPGVAATRARTAPALRCDACAGTCRRRARRAA